jgi:hypothetical protein
MAGVVMALVRVGGTYINVDRVTRILDLSTKDATGRAVPGPIRVYFGAGDWVDLTADAAVLRAWFGPNAQELPVS